MSLHTCPGRTNEHEQARTSNTARRTECNVIVKYNTQKRERERETGKGVSIRERGVSIRERQGYGTGTGGYEAGTDRQGYGTDA